MMDEILQVTVFAAAVFFGNEARPAIFTSLKECKAVMIKLERPLSEDGDQDDDAIADCTPITLKFRKPYLVQ